MANPPAFPPNCQARLAQASGTTAAVACANKDKKTWTVYSLPSQVVVSTPLQDQFDIRLVHWRDHYDFGRIYSNEGAAKIASFIQKEVAGRDAEQFAMLYT